MNGKRVSIGTAVQLLLLFYENCVNVYVYVHVYVHVYVYVYIYKYVYIYIYICIYFGDFGSFLHNFLYF